MNSQVQDLTNDRILHVLKLCGLLILENGGETYRAEETVMRICSAKGYGNSQVIAFPTGIIITLIRNGVTVGTVLQRVKKRTINLSKLVEVNDVSRQFTTDAITLETAIARLEAQNVSSKSNKLLYALFAAISTACFTLLFGGGLFDAAASFVCGGVVQYISSMFKRTDIYKFAISIIGGVVIALIAVSATSLFKIGSVDKIIVGAIMPLLPGIAMTNAIRDTMTGDLVSGGARLCEVLLVALALAAGVGVVFAVCIQLGIVLR